MNKMKVAVLGSILMFLISFLIHSPSAAETELGEGRISLIQGQVLIQTRDEGEWIEASINFPIADGDRIVTEQDGKVELHFQNGTYVRAGEISQLDIIALGFDQGKPLIHLNQLEGRIYVNHRPTHGEASSLYIDLPHGVLSSYAPSRFKVDLAYSETRISVLEGSIEFRSDGRPIPLTQGRTLIVKERGHAEVAQLYGRDEWDRWNEARDNELVQRRYTQKYLPPDLEPYGYEMEGYGRWVYTPEYQYIWIPTVVVGWTPFQYGYWTWRRGIYCWVPHERWGWVPFHYGRWVHTSNHGWAWVPPPRQGIIWNPGAVAWNISSSHVSWVPLAPGEIYYGNRYYGPQSLNINQMNINIQKNVYMNAKVKNSVVTVQKDSFSKRNPVKITQVENPFLKPAKISTPPTGKPVLVGEKKTPSRLMNGAVGKVQSERKPLPEELVRNILSVEKGAKVTEQKRVTESPQKRAINETAQGRVVGAVQSYRQINSSQGNSVEKDSISIPTGEKAKGENKVFNPEGNKNKNTPVIPPVTVKPLNTKEPKYSQVVPERNVPSTMNQDRSGKIEQSNSNKEDLGKRNLISPPSLDVTKVKSPNSVAQNPERNASINVNQNGIERAGQPNTFRGNIERNQSSVQNKESTKAGRSVSVQGGSANSGVSASPPKQVRSFSQGQDVKTFVGKPSLPEVKLSTTPASKGQVIQNNRVSAGRSLGATGIGSFR